MMAINKGCWLESPYVIPSKIFENSFVEMGNTSLNIFLTELDTSLIRITSPKSDIKIAPTESTFIIGSNSIHAQGDLYSLENTLTQKNSIKTFF